MKFFGTKAPHNSSLSFRKNDNSKNIIFRDEFPPPNPFDNLLFDTASFTNPTFGFGVPEPYLTALNTASARWSNYIKCDPVVAEIVYNYFGQQWSGIRLNSYYTINNSQSYIAACGVNLYFEIDPIPTKRYLTHSFDLYVNLYYQPFYTPTDWANIMTHELGHALGIGIYWDPYFELYGAVPPTNNFLSSTAYPSAGGAYNSILGSNRPQIALESDGSAGTQSAHWENSFRSSAAPGSNGFNYPGLQNELMVGFYSPSTNFVISNLSIKMLVDFGYMEKNPGANEGVPILVNS